MDINEIMRCLPHRYPMLLVDRITDFKPREGCTGIKNVTINESFFQGHYPGRPIMPGVLQIEAMAQTAAVVLLSDPEFKGMMPVIGAIDNIRFRKQVVPGDQLVMEMKLVKLRGTIGKVSGKASVDGEVASEMEMTFKLVATED